MVEEANVVDDFANRLKIEFEDRTSNASDQDESQDWFVNDKTKSEVSQRDRQMSSTAGTGTSTGTDVTKNVKVPVKKSNSAPADSAMAETVEEPTSSVRSLSKTSFLHYLPPNFGILVMELGTGEQIKQKRYGSKYFKIYLPQVHEKQTDYCLFARRRVNKNKFRFSLNEHSMSKWNNPSYGGKVVMSAHPQGKHFKLSVPQNAARVHFDIEQEARKQELVVRLNPQTTRFNLFRSRSNSEQPSEVHRCNLQKFINPIADIRCGKTNNTLFKVEKEGEAGNEKYIITYARPFSLFVSCCIAVGIEGHQLE
ncbi:TPA: hypothetical protein N0F65_007219 [Lagenidium giganteum]|uniref:Tubby C-terminal domain-containing protein n=1 Tax=Lagenidium giganteum TaxID=4803 RepID=A0AAV2Z912_9STRA|nr:TPA: hypothetical protein N0F65_007219 [Lagenidium giganteum]